MSRVIEVEVKYFCEKNTKIMEIIDNNNMKLSSSVNEVDEYFSDINSKYIENRTCLRIRKKNNKTMELTFKGKSNVLDNIYAKCESNIALDILEYEDVIEFLAATGYYSYVTVNKNRKVYSKEEDGLMYNLMLDDVKGIGNFVEFEILCEDENRSIDILKDKLNTFVEKFAKVDMSVADLPYRDFVARKIYKAITFGKEKNTLLLDLDGTLINSEQEFFQTFRDVIYSDFKYEINLNEYISNELDMDANLIKYLKDKKIIVKDAKEEEIMQKVYDLYETRFINIIYDKDTLVNVELVKQLKKKGIYVSLVSTCKRKFIDMLIERLDIENLFDIIVAREDVTNLKPNPEAYEKATKTLLIDRSKCIVVEDSNRGIASARGALLDVVSVDNFSLKLTREKNLIDSKSFAKIALILLNNT